MVRAQLAAAVPATPAVCQSTWGRRATPTSARTCRRVCRVHVGPEGDAYLGPDVSTGVPDYVGPGGDVAVPPGTVSGIPEPIGPGTEPTEPWARRTSPRLRHLPRRRRRPSRPVRVRGRLGIPSPQQAPMRALLR